MAETFDYVVVGGGTAGCIVAGRLAENPDVSVCVIEAGPSERDSSDVQRFANWTKLLGGPTDWNYHIEPQARGPADMLASRARMLGGCSSHNAVIALRAPDVDLQRWEELGAQGWGPSGTRAAFDRAMERVNVHGAGPYNPNAEAFVEASVQAGYPRVECNGEDIVTGTGWLPMNRRGDRRVSTETAYLPRLDRLPNNLAILTSTFAEHVIFDDECAAKGVRTDRGDVTATTEVILAAGVFNSPKLLMLSGIGPSEHLESLGIRVLVDLPGVGSQIVDHIETILMFESPRPVRADTVQSCEAATWIRTDSALANYDVFVHHVSAGYWMNGTDLGLPGIDQVEHAFTLAPYLARPASEGTVRLRSRDPLAPPVIDPGYFTDPDDRDARTLLAAIETCREIAAQPALLPWVNREVLPGPDLSAGRLDEYARRTANSEYHWAGGCRIGAADDEAAVVDPELRVRNASRIRVADGSIFPVHVGVNPCITTMMIGERCADLLTRSTNL